jgi:D-sedoheptulose 7-phosphate isomerase
MAFMEHYLQELKTAIDGLDLAGVKAVSDLLVKARQEGKTIFLCGLGGSSACASHFCNDLAKLTICSNQKRFRVINLSDNTPLFTAWMNDKGRASCFSEQLKNLFQEGDILIAFSTSGNSKSILQAVRYVNAHGGCTIGMTGRSNGMLAKMAQKAIVVPSNHMQRIEDVLLILCHLICSYILQKDSMDLRRRR